MKVGDTDASSYEFHCDAHGVWRVLDGNHVAASLSVGDEPELHLPNRLPARTVLELLRRAGVDRLTPDLALRCAMRLEGATRQAAICAGRLENPAWDAHMEAQRTTCEVARDLREAATATERKT